MTIAQATKEVEKDIHRLQRRVERILSHHRKGAVAFLDWRRELQDERYLEIHADLGRYATHNDGFRSVLKQTTEDYLRKVHPSDIDRLDPSRFEILSRYVLEELAMFLHLYHAGYKVEVYPGSDLDIVEAACSGKFPGFPVDSPERSHISLELTSP